MTQTEKLTLDYIKSQMSESRFKHVLSVAENAKKLAQIHNINQYDAETAGLLHDLAREWSGEQLIDFLKQRSIKISTQQMELPILLHGHVASIIVHEKFGINNNDLLNSVKNHTSGATYMSELEKIIFISDTLGSMQSKDPARYNEIMDAATKSLSKGVELIYELTYQHFIDNNITIAEIFFDNWNANKPKQI